jgi:anti-sigma factor RsiW
MPQESMGEHLMDHNEIRHALSDYLDGSLPSSERTAVEEHLKKCSACSDALSELKKTIDHLKGIEQIEPPAGMMQKIMARVREEDAKKKSVWRYWFFPFRFPVETVGLVLLAMTALFIYTNMQPIDRYSEHVAVRTEAPAPAPKQESPQEIAAPDERAVPQKPGYKALDMKQEYESPPPPMPGKAPAPPAQGPASGSAPEKKDNRAGTGSLDAATGVLKEEQPQSKAKAFSAPGKQRVEAGFILIRLRTRGTTQLYAKTEKAVKDVGGTVTGRDVSSGELVMTVKIDQAKRTALLDALRPLGRAEERAAIIDGQHGFEIVVTE